MPAAKLKLAVSQSRTLSSTAETLASIEATTRTAAQSGVDLILFPEALLGGYPRTANFGCSVGEREPGGRDQFLDYFNGTIDLGDTPAGGGDDFLSRKLPVAQGEKYRGDGTREELERIARETGVFVATGLVERAGGSLYCAVVYVCPRLGLIGKRRKVMPTGTERLIWAQGQPSTLRAVTTTIKGVRLTLAAAICWENYMPLLRQSLYSQNVNLYLAPTADPRDTWLPLMRTVGFEGRAFVLSANQCITRKNLPEWIKRGAGRPISNGSAAAGDLLSRRNKSIPRQPAALTKRRSSTISKTDHGHEICWPSPTSAAQATDSGMGEFEKAFEAEANANGGEHLDRTATTPAVFETDENHELALPLASKDAPKSPLRGKSASRPTSSHGDEFLSRGGSCIVSPLGEVLAGPLWEVEDGGFLIVEADFEDCARGRLDLDVAGSYSRSDAFQLTVQGLDLSPPP